jgi:ABC-2 type transport system permease protein
MAGALVIVGSGNLMPLTLFPDWMHLFMFVQPLAGLLDIPFRIYGGALAGGQAIAGIGLQLFWTVTLVGLGRWLLARTMRRLEVQGG